MPEYEEFLIYDKPIPYKDLLIYPVTVDNYISFHFYSLCLSLDKNSVPDPAVISMSYLEFLYYTSTTAEIPYLYMFKELLKMVLHINKDEAFHFAMSEKGKAYFTINGVKYTSDDADKIIDIIMTQNLIEHIDDSIQKEVRDEMEKAEMYKRNQYKMCSFEDQCVCILISTSLRFEDIYKLTIRKFSKILERVDHKLHYEIYLSAQMSGMVQFKDESKLKPWLADLSNNDKYADVKVDAEQMHKTIDEINK